MRSIKIKNFDALMTELRAEFANGKIVQARIESEGQDVVEGLYEPATGYVFVDPVPNVVDTLLHELLHRRYPRWGERRVSDTAHRLMTAMSDAERRQWYRKYQRATKVRTAVRIEA